MPSPLENEATDTPNSVHFFDRDWALPSGFGIADERRLNDIMANQYVVNDATALAEVFLSEADFAALLKINPNRDEARAFGKLLVEALGFGSAGN